LAKGKKDKQWSKYTGYEIRGPKRVISSFSNSGTRRVIHVKIPMISHIRGYIMNEENTGHSVTVNQVIIATVMISTLPSGTINFVVLLLIEPLYEDNIDRNSEISYQLRYIYIP